VRPAPKITPKFVVAVVEQAREIATEEATRGIPSRVGIAVVLVGVTLIGWGLMRSTWAQDSPKPAKVATPVAADLKPEPLPVKEGFRTDAHVVPPPLVGDAVPEASVPKLSDSVPVADPIPPSPGAPTQSPLDLDSPAQRTVSDNDDPEKTVQAFVEQNRKVAESQLKNLKDEGEKLRARLQKVEGGIKRWEALLAAIEKSGAAASSKGLSLADPRVPGSIAPRSFDSAPPELPSAPPAENPTELSPVPAPIPVQPAPR
jgi:hypothetical protein